MMLSQKFFELESSPVEGEFLQQKEKKRRKRLSRLKILISGHA